MMHKILLNRPGRLALRVADFITANDYYDLRPLLDTTLRSTNDARLYWEMEYFRGWQPDEHWRDLQFDLMVIADFVRIALVGTPENVALITPVMQSIFRAELRAFSPDHKQAAWQWFADDELPMPNK